MYSAHDVDYLEDLMDHHYQQLRQVSLQPIDSDRAGYSVGGWHGMGGSPASQLSLIEFWLSIVSF